VVVVADVVIGTSVVVVVGEASVVVVVGAASVVVVVGAASVVVVVGAASVVVVVGAAEQVARDTALSSRVTAPLRASTRPSTDAPVSSVADVRARIVPTKSLVVPIVAELPTCQKTLHAWAPFSSATVLPEAVVRVDPARKMKTELASPPPFNVKVPLSAMLEAAS
jgi:hypothetical protein